MKTKLKCIKSTLSKNDNYINTWEDQSTIDVQETELGDISGTKKYLNKTKSPQLDKVANINMDDWIVNKENFIGDDSKPHVAYWINRK